MTNDRAMFDEHAQVKDDELDVARPVLARALHLPGRDDGDKGIHRAAPDLALGVAGNVPCQPAPKENDQPQQVEQHQDRRADLVGQVLEQAGLHCQFSEAEAARHTQPVGLGKPATLHAPRAGPLGNSS